MIPIGYTHLNQHYKLLLPKLGKEVYQDLQAEIELDRPYGGTTRLVLSKHTKTPDSPYEHMIAAIKYQGIRLHFFAAIFLTIDIDEFAEFIGTKPNAKMHRVLWHLYEWLTDKQLPLSDLTSGNYLKLFDPQYYYTLNDGWRDRRTRVQNNAIGTAAYCPTVRKTNQVLTCAKTDVYGKADEAIQKVGLNLSGNVIDRSIKYLYTKETRSSHEIENEKIDRCRMERFLNTIKNAGLFELSKEKLIDIQNKIVDESNRADDYRMCEIYVGLTIQRFGEMDEDVHYIGAPPRLLDSVMDGLLKTHDNLMQDRHIPALIHASIISFGEVYIHPFEDGNGRIHRYLIHDVMRQRSPEHKFIIPISASILKNNKLYDEVLEVISKPLMSMLDYEFDDNQHLVVHNNIDYMYRYPDFTEHVVFIYEMMNAAISDELIQEVVLLTIFDLIKSTLSRQFDIPNKKLDTLVSILLSNGGQVSNAKRDRFLAYIDETSLTAIETLALEAIETSKRDYQIDIELMMNQPIR